MSFVCLCLLLMCLVLMRVFYVCFFVHMLSCFFFACGFGTYALLPAYAFVVWALRPERSHNYTLCRSTGRERKRAELQASSTRRPG